MPIEIACGPISELEFAEEISFVCSLFADAGSAQVSVMFGWACKAQPDQLWRSKEIVCASLSDWIAAAIQDGIFEPGRSDLSIESDGLTVLLCHEADIHVMTQSASVIATCSARWLRKGFRLLRSDQVPPERTSWRDIRTVEEAIAGLEPK